MLGAIEVRMSLTCDACDTGIPINGPVPLVKCSRCLELTRLEGRFSWPTMRRSAFTQAVSAERPTLELRHDADQLRLTTRSHWPACAGCGKDHQARAVKLALIKGKPITCSCGQALDFQPVPAHFAAAFPYVRGLVDADVFDEQPGPPAGHGAPVVIACMSCRGALPVDGKHRLIACSYCQASNYLPDDLWLSLHPVPKREAWFIVFDEDEVLTSIGR